MMDCKTAEQLMSDYIMNLTDESVKEELEKHLSECESCKKLCDELKKERKEFENQPKEKPFKKINKVIKSQKLKKTIFICLSVILLTVLIIITIGELNPESGLPSITRFRYKQKAKEITQNLFDGDIDALLQPIGTKNAGANLSNSKSQIGTALIADYTKEIKELYNKTFTNKNFKIEKIRLQYEKGSNSFFEHVYSSDESYVNYYYKASVLVNNNGIKFFIEIRFDNLEEYSINLYDEHFQKVTVPDTYLGNLAQINRDIEFIYMFINDLDWKKYILYGRMVDPDRFVGLSNNMFSLDCLHVQDETYVTGLNERLEKIKSVSCTESADFIIRGYNSEKHAISVQLIWKIKDESGKKAVMTKDFIQGPIGYQKLDETEQFIEEEGFSPELKQMLEEAF